MSSQNLLSELAVKIYEPPLSEIRESGAIADMSNPICVLMLLIDFDTQVCMNGIVNFIGNSTGLYAKETVSALEHIGCSEESRQLADILAVAAAAGITHEAIQADRSSVELYSVTTFPRLHGSKWHDAVADIESIHNRMDMQNVFDKIEQFIAQHRSMVEEALGVQPSDA
jgi:hypothetical protein